MLSKVPRLIFCDEVMEGTSEEGKIAVIVIGNGSGESLVTQGHQMLKIDIERRKVIDAQPMNLSNIVLVAAHSA